MNIAMILEMAADALGDRLAYGTRADGPLLRGPARTPPAASPSGSTAAAPSASPSWSRTRPSCPPRCSVPPGPGVSYAPLNYRLPEAQLEALLGRIEPAVVAAPHWLDNKGTSDRSFPDAPDAPAVLLFTSGTSAEPKAAILEHDQLLAYIFNTLEFASAGEDEAAIVVVPPFHVAGVAAVLVQHLRRTPHRAGARRALLGRGLVGHRPRRGRHPRHARAHHARQDRRGHGGRRVAARAHPAAPCRTAAPRCTRRSSGGRWSCSPRSTSSTRTGSPRPAAPSPSSAPTTTVSRSTATNPSSPPDSDRSASRSRASSSASSATSGETLGPDEPGEILIKGDQVGGKYVGTDSKVDADGWLHTGDRGWLDIEGYVFCEGRADDTIIRGGENIGPAEVEDALLQHDAISVAAVVGLADEQYGEKIAAMISLRGGVDEVDLDHVREWVRERIGSLKTPEDIVVVDEVPQTATGKLLRREVKRLLEEG